MTDGKEDISQRVTATANRLRMVQIDFADQDESMRREYLSEEVQRAVAGIVPEQRQAFLEELQARFPTWDAIELQPATARSSRSAFDEKELKDWTFLVTRLAELAPSLPEDARQAIIERLQTAGLTASGKAGWSQQLNVALRTKLQVPSTQELHPDRSAELLDILVDFATGLDLLAWNTWKQMAPQSNMKRTAPLLKEMGRFIINDANVPRGQVAASVNRLRTLVAAIISAVGQVGRKFAGEYYQQYAPAQIEDLIRAEGGSGMFGNAKVKCWEKYVQLSAARDATAVEQDIMASIAEYAETLMKGLGR